jgi:hypothetical protein
MATLRPSLTRLGYSLGIAMAVQLILGVALEVIGIPYSGYGIGNLLWDFHTPGRLVFCLGLRLCGGYDHFVFSDSLIIGEPQYPDRFDLFVLGLVNAMLIGLTAFLVWSGFLLRSCRRTTGKAAA